ncbi:hydroxysteroid dehydrogenase-like protein 1 [Diaphorina citri]|uniref:Hydroxysteroid dehydrogenase-like protein 1 n=1 Tax=Diaphorina citri TaxID=121845 RepID=A0A3Q0J1K8_DIACI|nr:hydroxysteroid dehydrogenase-like protein 1 [Diaphorina citri]
MYIIVLQVVTGCTDGIGQAYAHELARRGINIVLISRTLEKLKKTAKEIVVTGCTDGIGQAYAHELARRGINIVLISRTLEKLKKTAKEIETTHGVQTKIIAADMSEGKAALDKIKTELEGHTIGILVNNVGANYTYPMYLDEIPERDLWNLINLNIATTTMLTKLVLPQMKERGRGAIVNVSSSSEGQPWPLFTVYAASKIYIRYFSEALRVEYQKYGITVQHIAPAFVSTKMNNFSYRVRNKSFFVPDAEQYARSAVSTLGVTDTSTGFWVHGIQAFFTNLCPLFLRVQLGCIMNQTFREDYLNQKSRQVLNTPKIE